MGVRPWLLELVLGRWIVNLIVPCGCLLVIYLLRLTDGPGAVLVAAVVAVAGAVCFALDEGRGPILTTAAVSGVVELRVPEPDRAIRNRSDLQRGPGS